MNFNSDYDKGFKVLQLDGGGGKGIIFLTFLSALEKMIGKTCPEIFNLFIGTSTGGITAALMASGMSAGDILNLYKAELKNIFSMRLGGILNPIAWFTGSRYDRIHIDNLARARLDMPMGATQKQIVITSVNMKDAEHTHFFKSYMAKDADIPLYAPVMATYSAPTYFGYFKDRNDVLKSGIPGGGVWSDGGVGIMTCTLMQAYIECKRQDKLDDYFILSCGCGYTGLEGYSDFIVSQIADYIPIASEQSISEQVNQGRQLGINFFRVDGNIKKEYSAMDKVKYIPQWIEYGEQWVLDLMHQLIV